MQEVFCSILVVKFGSDVSKRGQRCGMYALLGYFYGIFLLIWGKKASSRNGFLTDQIFLRPQGTVDANCLGCSVRSRLKRESQPLHPRSPREESAQVYLLLPLPEITHLPYQTHVLQKKMEVKLWLISSVCRHKPTSRVQKKKLL